MLTIYTVCKFHCIKLITVKIPNVGSHKFDLIALPPYRHVCSSSSCLKGSVRVGSANNVLVARSCFTATRAQCS